MAYEKQNFEDGLVLCCTHLNKMEDGIAQNAADIAAKVGISKVENIVGVGEGSTNKMTIYLTNGTSHTITVSNGLSGKNGTDGSDGTGVFLFDPSVGYISQDEEDPDVHYYNRNESVITDGSGLNTGSLLLTVDGDLYICTSYRMGSIGVKLVGSIKGADGNDYVLTEADKAEIAEMAASLVEGSKATIGTVELPAASWVGSGNLYSQVVTIAGVTENSQVDLTPSVEQLVVFYEKDLTFVTENEGGVVTVYAIGQKPTNDYTIQVTITEVSV